MRNNILKFFIIIFVFLSNNSLLSDELIFNTEKIKTNLNVLAFESAHNEASKLFSKFS